MKILITGATGFIGKEVLKLLSKKNFKIIATFSNKKPNNLVIPKVKWKKLDIFNHNSFKIENNIDLVIHLIWPFLPDYQNKKHLTINLNAQKKFINSLTKKGIKNFFFAGTCYEYGKQSGKLKENIKKKPNNPYAISKNLLNSYLISLSKKKKINITWGRIFYIYGFNERRDTLYNLIIDKRKREQIKVANNFFRDYLDIKTIAKLIVILSLAKKNFGTVNLSSGFAISLKNLINYFLRTNQIKATIKYEKKTNTFEPDRFYGDNTKLKKILKQNLSDFKYQKKIKEILKHK